MPKETIEVKKRKAAQSTCSFQDHILTLFETIHPLDRIPRAGYLLRGVPEPESVAAHSHFVSLLTLLFCDRYPDEFDTVKTLKMAITHDLSEATLMDIPMPTTDKYFKEAKENAEQAITEELLNVFSKDFAQLHRELLDARTPEARLVRGLDKAQMMIKIAMYEREGKGRLDEFWSNPRNFNDFNIRPVSDLFDTICKRAGRKRPH